MNGQRHTVSLLNRAKRPLLHAVSRASQPLLPLRNLVAWSGQRVLVPFYHAISDEPLPHLAPLYPVRSQAQFSRDLDFLLRHFQPVDLPEIVALCGHSQAVTGGQPIRPRVDKPVFHLTIDDGLRSAGEAMADLLRAKGVPATLFVNSAFVGNRALMYRYTAALIVSHLRAPRPAAAQAGLLGEGLSFLKQHSGTVLRPEHLEAWILAQGYEQRSLLEGLAAQLGLDIPGFLARERPYLTLDELRNLQRQGFHVGSHSIDHPWYQDLDPAEQLRQTVESHQWVQANLPGSPAVFAFPFSDAGLPWSLMEQGFAQGIALHFGGPGLRSQAPGALSRVAMEKDRSEAGAIIRLAYLAGWGKRMLIHG
jgi:peptidoglycan/xylan/chitin deacetylase (PgdA/CDA1 family)